MKKFFPKNAKTQQRKGIVTSKKIKKPLPAAAEKNSKSLKEEFDFIIKYHYKKISADAKKQIWHNIIVDLKENIPFTGSLIYLIYRLIFFSYYTDKYDGGVATAVKG